jgi:hypothetical protein
MLHPHMESGRSESMNMRFIFFVLRLVHIYVHVGSDRTDTKYVSSHTYIYTYVYIYSIRCHLRGYIHA